ncbi:MAG: RNA polymerase factor sigma-54 [Armatimonadetes bacterium]|nr:RNA polymerase factor sigma-54 [Armatimonadota bacterium]
MDQRLRISNRGDLRVVGRVDPRLIVGSKVLQVGQAELEQLIDTELQENPALERLEQDDPLGEQDILESLAPGEYRRDREDSENWRSSTARDEAITDWADLAAGEPSLQDHLRAQLFTVLPKDQWLIAEYLVESIDDRGFLSTPIEEVALAVGCSLEEAESVLKELQRCDPVGVGAADVKQCLLLQLSDPQTFEQRLARIILRRYMEDFTARRIQKLCRHFKAVPEVIEAAFAEILALSPFPAEDFSTSPTYQRQSKAIPVYPDIKISRTEQGYEIEVKGAEPTEFKIDRTYQQKFEEAARGKMDKDERRHVVTYVNRASTFIDSLNQRKQTMQLIGRYLVEKQGSFISTGQYQYLAPLTRVMMANDLGVHESTISRATDGKFVQLATNEVVSFDVFFKPALRVQKMIEDILQTENPANPLSDERIAQMLAEQGVKIARRTVNKYRDKYRMLNSRRRRSA